MCQRLLALDEFEALRIGCNRQRSLVDPAGRLPGFVFQCAVERNRVLDQVSQVPAAAQCAHLGRRMPGGAGSQFVALEQDRIADTRFRQVVKSRTTHDTTTDNYHGGMSR